MDNTIVMKIVTPLVSMNAKYDTPFMATSATTNTKKELSSIQNNSHISPTLTHSTQLLMMNTIQGTIFMTKMPAYTRAYSLSEA